jgi:hypothetical protein
MSKGENAYKILLGKYGGRKPFGILSRKWQGYPYFHAYLEE